MYCTKCGTQNPDDAAFCFKCGKAIGTVAQTAVSTQAPAQIVAPAGVTQLKCPTCGGPIAPKFGEMVITCEYCGGTVTLGNQGWKNIQKHTMLPLKFPTQDEVMSKVHQLMDHGLLRRHLQESSKLEEFSLTVIPYWIVPVAARTSIVATDTAVQVGSLATTAALLGVIGVGMAGGGRGTPGIGGGMLEGMMLGSVMGGGMGGMGGGGARQAFQFNDSYNFPVVALKALTEYQPRDYRFALDERILFDASKFPKAIKILNGDVGEDMAKYQAKTLVDQLQSQKAHAKYHMIQQLQTEMDVGEGEIMHVPVWFAKYDHKGSKIILVTDGNSGNTINSMGL